MTDAADHSPLRKGALAAIRSERVRILTSDVDASDYDRYLHVVARVISSRQGGGRYAVDFRDGEWRCTCRNGQTRQPCAHVHAVQLVTTGVPA